jgi:23S rRNA (guanosine2251-2'-O)-methyltransferase
MSQKNKQKQSQKIQRNKSTNNTRGGFSSQAPRLLDSELWLCGKHPTFTILQKKRRKIFEILATQNSISELEKFLQKNSLAQLLPFVKITENEKIEALFGKNQLHQGLAVRCSRLPTKNQNDLLIELEKISQNQEKLPTLILLDQISDPHNIGAIIRSALSFGVKHIIFCEHNSPKENATIVKSSAGTIEMADLFVVTNFSNLFEKLKKIGYWCVGLASEGVMPIAKVREYKNIALVVGSEGDGIRGLVKKNCDLLTRIEIDREVESLNASVAAAIALYEISRV